MSDWKDLTDYEIEAIHVQDQFWNDYWDEYIGEGYEELDPGKFALAIQEALKVKNEEMACIKLLADIRQACGDDGKRMQDELVQYITELYRQAESVEHLQHRVSELEDTLKRQGNAAKSGMDAAKRAASQSEENAKRLLAESNPESLESERAANAELSREVEWVQARVSELEAGQKSVSVPESWRSTMKELSDDLESEIESRRSSEIDRRVERDLIVVKEARALLAAQEQDEWLA